MGPRPTKITTNSSYIITSIGQNAKIYWQALFFRSNVKIRQPKKKPLWRGFRWLLSHNLSQFLADGLYA